MRHWLVLLAVYATVAAFVLPSSLPAAQADDPAASTETVAEAAPPAHAPPATPASEAPPAETTPLEPVPAEPPPAAPPPAPEAAPAPAPAEPAQAEPPGAEAAPAEELGDERDGPLASAADTANVVISDFEFTPPTITIVVGDTVTWTNDGPTGHSATAVEGSFDTGIFPAGESRSVTFDEAGEFAYLCTPHPNMEGTVVVEAAQADREEQEEDVALENAEEDEDVLVAEDTLPVTGKDIRAMVILGLLMLALGAAIQLRTRRQA